MHFLCTGAVERHKRTQCDSALKHKVRNRGVLQEYFETASFWIMTKRPLNKSVVFKTRFLRVNNDNYENNRYGGGDDDDYKHNNKTTTSRSIEIFCFCGKLGPIHRFVGVRSFFIFLSQNLKSSSGFFPSAQQRVSSSELIGYI